MFVVINADLMPLPTELAAPPVEAHVPGAAARPVRRQSRVTSLQPQVEQRRGAGRLAGAYLGAELVRVR